MHAARGDLRVVARDLHTRQHAHLLGETDAVGALEHIVELLVKVARKLVKQPDNIDTLRALRVNRPEELPSEAREEEVERDGLEHKWSLHLYGHLLPGRAQRRLVNLSPGGCAAGGTRREAHVGRPGVQGDTCTRRRTWPSEAAATGSGVISE